MAVADQPILRNIPNALTVLRLLAVPVFILLMVVEQGTSLAAGLVFMAAAFTDFFDGWIARKLGVMSQFGKVLDPIADRLLVNSAAILLCFFDDRLLGFEFVIVCLRDFVGMYGYARLRHYVIPDVSRLGKFGMMLMMGGLAWLLVLPQATWPIWLFWPGLVISVVVMGRYVWKYRWALRGRADVYSGRSGDAQGAAPIAGEESRGSAS